MSWVNMIHIGPTKKKVKVLCFQSNESMLVWILKNNKRLVKFYYGTHNIIGCVFRNENICFWLFKHLSIKCKNSTHVKEEELVTLSRVLLKRTWQRHGWCSIIIHIQCNLLEENEQPCEVSSCFVRSSSAWAVLPWQCISYGLFCKV